MDNLSVKIFFLSLSHELCRSFFSQPCLLRLQTGIFSSSCPFPFEPHPAQANRPEPGLQGQSIEHYSAIMVFPMSATTFSPMILMNSAQGGRPGNTLVG